MAKEYNIPYKFIKGLSKRQDKTVISDFNSMSYEERKENIQLLTRCSNLWTSLDDFRKESRRLMRYRDGDQWSDLMDGVDDRGRRLTEAEYILQQNKVPLKNNLISSIVRNVVNIFRSNKTEPEVIARNENSPKLGEMMSVALQYVHQQCDMSEIDAEALEQLLITGMCVQMVRYDAIKDIDDNDVTVDNIDRNCVFFSHNFNNGRQNEVNLIGMFEDLSIDNVISRYAHSHADKKRIEEIYAHCDKKSLHEYYNGFLTDSHFWDINFYSPMRDNLCRVIHVWEQRNKEVLWCHDPLNGQVEIHDLNDEKKILAENTMRMADGLANGVLPEDIENSMLIRYKYKVITYYYVKHLTPRGDVLFEGENKFWHKQHPFVFLMHPFHDGEIHSFVSDFIDQQRYINRLVMMIDFMMSASAKSLLIFPVDCLGEMTKDEVIDEYIKTNGVIFARMRPGASMPTELTSRVNYMGATELLNIQLQLLNKVSGVSESLQGQQAKSGTAASLYAQESQNSANNVIGIIDAFNSFRRKRDMKIMKTIQQFWNDKKFINIAGHDYSDEAKFYDPAKVRNIQADVVINESTATPAYRMAMNNMLMQLVQTQAMSLKTMIKGSTLPFKDKILTLLEKEEEEQAQNMMALQQGQQPQNSPEIQQMTQEIQNQLGQNSNQQVNNLINQALQQ